jgi:hypothetical protein
MSFCPFNSLSGSPRRASSQTVVDPLAVLLPLHQSRLFENRHVLGNGGRRQIYQFNDLTNAKLAGIESHQNPDSVFVAEGLGNRKKILHNISYNSPIIELLYNNIGKSQHVLLGI